LREKFEAKLKEERAKRPKRTVGGIGSLFGVKNQPPADGLENTAEALEQGKMLCGDADYRAAIGKLQKLHVGYRGEGALELAITGSTLSATVSATSFDPREVARTWLHDNL
jgi:hypothetical protein